MSIQAQNAQNLIPSCHPERDIKVVRTIEDGNLVFVHVHQYLNGGETQWVTTDTFRADENGRIVEHWDNKEVMLKVEDLTNRGKF